MRAVASALAATLILSLSVACGGGSSDSTTEPTPSATPAAGAGTPQEQAAAAAQAMQQGMQALGKSQTATAVQFEQLIALLPELPGWTRETPRGDQFSAGITVSRAQASYRQGDDLELDLEIVDTAFSQLLMLPMSMMLMENYSERDSDGYKKGMRLAGHPGFEEWRTDSKHGEVTVVVANRFIVKASGNDMPTIDTLKSAIQAVDLGRLAALK
jgi:hypothetical protein